MKLSLGLTPRDYSVAGGAVSYDADAQAYFTANTSITSDADKNAINDFYLGLKSDGIYTKIKAMYLPIWGSAASCKWNLVNPVDTNAAYRLTFATGMTFTSGGMVSNGTSGYADTYLIPNNEMTLNSTHISFYSRTDNNNTTPVISDQTGTGNTTLNLWPRYGAGNDIYFRVNSSASASAGTNSDSRGFFIANRVSSTGTRNFKNTTLYAQTQTSGALNTSTMWIARQGTPGAYDNRQCSFASLGLGLTDTEASNFYTRVNTLMTYFGINV